MYAIDNQYHQTQEVEAGKFIFNHDIMTCTDDSVVGNYLYSGRALGLTNPNDIIQLHPDLESQWNSIVEHYARIELEHTHQVIWNVKFDTLAIIVWIKKWNQDFIRTLGVPPLRL